MLWIWRDGGDATAAIANPRATRLGFGGGGKSQSEEQSSPPIRCWTGGEESYP